jgi:hypothetical protein
MFTLAFFAGHLRSLRYFFPDDFTNAKNAEDPAKNAGNSVLKFMIRKPLTLPLGKVMG